jgi:predicted aspartyl protease
MPGYDAENSNPPAPVANVLLRNPETGAEISPIVMLVDTGADVTLIPRGAALQIGCRPVNAHTLSGFDGATGNYDEVFVEMVFLDKSFTGQFLTVDQPTGTIGRNVLNHLVLTFDGPRLTWGETRR